MGPGQYDVDRASKVIQTKTTNVNIGSTVARPESFAKSSDINVAPGQYDAGKSFGSDAKSF